MGYKVLTGPFIDWNIQFSGPGACLSHQNKLISTPDLIPCLLLACKTPHTMGDKFFEPRKIKCG